MADSWDWLEGLSGGLSGIVKGIDTGMAPLKTWEGIRTSDLANDASEIRNEDLYQLQQARMGGDVPDYYGQKIGAELSGFGKTQATNAADIFGQQQRLALASYLADPEGAFQQGVQQAGLEPGSPEYRQWLAEAMSMYDPTGALAAYDKMNIPGIQNRNLNEQAALTFIENYARKKDPEARVVRNADGTVMIVGADGEMTPVPGDLMVQVASMISAKTPYDAISQGLKDETAIQRANTELAKALMQATGKVTPSNMLAAVTQQRTSATQMYNADLRDYTAITKSPEYLSADDATKMQMVAPLRQRMDQTRARLDILDQQLARFAKGDFGQGARGGAGITLNPITGMPMAPRGGATVTAPRFNQRPSVANIFAQATGQAPAVVGPPASLAGELMGPASGGAVPSDVNLRDPSRNSFTQIMQLLNSFTGGGGQVPQDLYGL